MAKSATWPELDVLRGLAGVVMVLNHAAAHWTAGPDATGLAWLLFTVGSYAPVLFFTATGLGYGIQAEHKGPDGGHAFGFARKVAILLLADSLLWLSPVTWLGNDFLGFIALTMLVLEPLRRSRRGWWIAIVAALAIAGLRYVVIPRLFEAPLPGADISLTHWVLGFGSPPGFSYPPLPWLAYGLVGFSVGVLAQRFREVVAHRRARITTGLVIATGLGLAFVLWRLDRGSTLSRWGSVNGTFFVSGFVGVVGASALALLLTLVPAAPRWIGLRGTASLALVPVHFGVIELFERWTGAKGSTGVGFVVAASIAAAVSMALARQWPAVIERVGGMRHAWAGLVVVSGGSLVAQLLVEDPGGRMLALVAGQLSLCALLVVHRR